MDGVLNYYIGVDPGLSGAVALISSDNDYRVFDIPVMSKGSGVVKSEINSGGMKEILALALSGAKSVAALERVNAMPGQGVSSVFSLGDSFGSCRAVLACLDIPTFYVTPTEWKKFFGLTSDKEQARALAIRLFPKADLKLKKNIDRAEALLIASYLKQKIEKAQNDKTVLS
jgi:crossover junction endodeoxyribonuclease RuvC